VAQKVTVIVEDDLTGGPAEWTVRLAFDGQVAAGPAEGLMAEVLPLGSS
jgi:hypothetical protein